MGENEMHGRERVVVDGLEELELDESELEEVAAPRVRFALHQRPTRPFACGDYARAVESAEARGSTLPEPPDVDRVPTARPPGPPPLDRQRLAQRATPECPGESVNPAS